MVEASVEISNRARQAVAVRPSAILSLINSAGRPSLPLPRAALLRRSTQHRGCMPRTAFPASVRPEDRVPRVRALPCRTAFPRRGKGLDRRP